MLVAGWGCWIGKRPQRGHKWPLFHVARRGGQNRRIGLPTNDECNSQIACRGLRVIEHSRHIPCHWSSRADAFNLSSFYGLRPSRALACGSGAPLPVVFLDEI